VVSDGERRHLEPRRLGDEFVDAAGAVAEREDPLGVQVDEAHVTTLEGRAPRPRSVG